MKKRKKLSTLLFKKNQIVKKNSLPSKYELQMITPSCSKFDDDFDDEFYEDVNFNAKFYVNKK